MIPVKTPFFLPLLYPSLLWRIPTTQNEIFLTFDDGPVSGPTEFVLEVLQKYSVTATFFCIGDNVRKYPGVFQAVINGGHAIGNHTFHHVNGWKTPHETYMREIDACWREMDKFAKPAGKLFRPPYGRLTRKQIGLLEDHRVVMWDVLTKDYDATRGGEKCLRDSINATRKGSIVVFHDSFKAERNLKFVLPRYIEHFLNSGFLFKTIHQ